MSGCLEGIRVLELARFQAGPRAGMILSDMGAEVIKVEKPGGESSRSSGPLVNGLSMYFTVYNRGKKSMCLDLRKSAGLEIFRELVKSADIVLENFRPGTMEAMGLDYEALCRLKPDIIMLRVSAYGQYGPHKHKTGFDPIGQALSGLMTLTGQTEGKPIATAFSLVDRTTALHCTIGALGALRYRDQTGEGQVVDVCLMDSGLTMVEIPTGYYLSTGEEGGESGRVPFQAKDGWVVMAGIGEIRSLLIDLGLDPDEKSQDATYPLSILNRMSPVHGKLNDWCKQHTVAEVCETLESYGAIVAPVRTTPEVAEDPHLSEREMFVKVPNPYGGEVFVPGLSIKFSKTPGEVRPVALPGQHTAEILSELLHYSANDIARLRDQEVI